jgi:hypothetical protein
MTTHELTAAYVGDAKIIQQNGRAFTAFKQPGAQRNTLFELNLSTWALTPIGLTPGTYYKDGGCDLTFDQTGQLLMLNTCSPDPSTGAAARVVLWETGIIVGPIAGGSADGLVRSCLRALRGAVATALAPLG